MVPTDAGLIASMSGIIRNCAKKYVLKWNLY